MRENQIIVYQPNETVRLDVRLENETVWLNRHQMAQLFGRDVKTIGKHIANALKEELSDWATTAPHHNEASLAVVAKFATTAVDGKTYQVEYYNLDVILSVGYRVEHVGTGPVSRGDRPREAGRNLKKILRQS